MARGEVSVYAGAVLERLLWVCAGGALGSGARFLMVLAVDRQWEGNFPYGTLLVNLVGSFALGLIVAAGPGLGWLSDNGRLALGTGVLGAFTTYSAHSLQSAQLLEQKAWSLLALNMGGTLALCLLASVTGLALGKTLA